MPAAAVIPASVAYIKVAAVKRLVVECLFRVAAGGRWGCCWLLRGVQHTLPSVNILRTRVQKGVDRESLSLADATVTLSKSECSKQS